MEQHRMMHGNKPSWEKLDLNLENVIGSVISLEIAKGELMYVRDYVKARKGIHGIKLTID